MSGSPSPFNRAEVYLLYNLASQVLLVSELPPPASKPANAPDDWQPPLPTKSVPRTQSFEKYDPLPNDIPGALFNIIEHPSNPGAFLIKNTATRLALTRDAQKIAPTFDSTIDSAQFHSDQWSIMPVDGMDSTYVIANLDTRGLSTGGQPFWFLSRTSLLYGPLRKNGADQKIPLPQTSPTYTFGADNIAPIKPDKYTWKILTYSEVDELNQPPPLLQRLIAIVTSNPLLLYAGAGLGGLMFLLFLVMLLGGGRKQPTKRRRVQNR